MHSPSILDVPSDAQAAAAVLRARSFFARTLACWACDALTLRRSGGHRAVFQARARATPIGRAA